MRTEKQQELLDKWIVAEAPNGEKVIFYRDNFEWLDYCRTYNQYGVLNDSDYCHGEEDENGNPIDDDHWQLFGYTHWNGSNWITYFLGDEDFNDYCELKDEEAIKILEELPEDFPYIDGISEDVETENYTFGFTRYAVPYHCTVE